MSEFDPAGGDPVLPPEVQGTLATVGTFDGVHLGHCAILRELAHRARVRGLRSLLVTFDRHPLMVVNPEHAPLLLTTPNEKKEILAQFELDFVVFLPFTRSLSRYSPATFVRRLLVSRFRVRELVIGPDHGFGRSRSGDSATLERLGARFGFEVDVVPELDVAGKPVSSSRVRRAVEAGDVEHTSLMLGRPYSLWGVVVHGMGRGRSLGFPTANLGPPSASKLLPRPGIYTVRASLRSQIRNGLLHLGPRPTFPGSPPSLELYLLDFDEEIYGEAVQVEFLSRLRDVRPFDSVAALVEQMRRDRKAAVRYFEADALHEAGRSL